MATKTKGETMTRDDGHLADVMATETARQVPDWVPEGRTRKTLEDWCTTLGQLPNKDGKPELCKVDIDGNAVVFTQHNAAGDGEPITVRLTNTAYIKQLDARLAS